MEMDSRPRGNDASWRTVDAYNHHVIPAKAGIQPHRQPWRAGLDPGLRRGDMVGEERLHEPGSSPCVRGMTRRRGPAVLPPRHFCNICRWPAVHTSFYLLRGSPNGRSFVGHDGLMVRVSVGHDRRSRTPIVPPLTWAARAARSLSGGPYSAAIRWTAWAGLESALKSKPNRPVMMRSASCCMAPKLAFFSSVVSFM
jgi:hypothetical protein